MKFIKGSFDKTTKSGKLKFEVDIDQEIERHPQGNYVLVKVETLNDEIAIEEFIEQQKNK